MGGVVSRSYVETYQGLSVRVGYSDDRQHNIIAEMNLANMLPKRDLAVTFRH
jgi:hypothetical protein